MDATISRTPYHSYCTGPLSEGCQQCVRGQKVVLFITGHCGQKCFYCPVSEHKYGHDVVYANEWKIENPADPVELIKEAELTQAKGAGITGGDPLVNLPRCVKYIQLLKSKFGKQFHIHLYAPLLLVTTERLKALYDAGLDEIRVHPSLEETSLWNRLDLLKKFDWKVGIEIPTIPGKEEITKKLIEFAAGKIDFMNFNELELSDTTASHYKLHQLGFIQKSQTSYGVQGSASMAIQLLAIARDNRIAAHFCTAKLKDAIQLKNRMKLRAQTVALPCDTMTPQGLLLRGILYLPNLQPDAEYDTKMKTINAAEVIQELTAQKQEILQILPAVEVVIDTKKLRLILSKEAVKKNATAFKKLGLIPAIVEEYPTSDATEMEITFL